MRKFGLEKSKYFVQRSKYFTKKVKSKFKLNSINAYFE